MNNQQAYIDADPTKSEQLRQCSTIGRSLFSELDKMVSLNQLTTSQAKSISRIFDLEMTKAMEEFQANPSRIEGKMTGTLDMYRYCEGVGDIECSNVTLKYTKPHVEEIEETDRVFFKLLDSTPNANDQS